MRFLFPLILLLAFAAGPVSQSNSPQSPAEISGEPRHHPKFENEFVRILDVTVPAGDATLWHVHRNDNVVVTLDGASLRLDKVGAPTFSKRRLAPPSVTTTLSLRCTCQSVASPAGTVTSRTRTNSFSNLR